MTLPTFITVHVRVNDAATGKPTPVRLRIASPNGEYFAPFGRVAEFPLGRNEDVGGNVFLGGKRYTYIDGTCEIRLPTGAPLDVEISKGIDYLPIRETITLGAGQMALRFALERSFDRRARGWTFADTRCHFLSPHAALLEAQAEGLDLVHLLAAAQDLPSQDGHLYRTIPNMIAFSGQQAAHAGDGCAVAVNTLNTHPTLGRLGLLNCHRPVYPLSFGGDSTDDWSLCDWANQCHRKKGLAVWCDAYRPEAGLPGGEALVAAVLGKIDAIELDARDRQQPFLPFWYRLLNAGVRLAIVGGSAKDSNRIALGAMRTMTPMESQSGNLAEWVEATRRGRTIVSNGPILEMETNRHNDNCLIVRARVQSLVPHSNVEVVCNGEVIADSGSNREVEIQHALPNGGWLAARCRGTARSVLDHRMLLFAHTSPVYVDLPARRWQAPSALRSIVDQVQQVRLWVERHGRFAQEKSKVHFLELCDEALRILAERGRED